MTKLQDAVTTAQKEKKEKLQATIPNEEAISIKHECKCQKCSLHKYQDVADEMIEKLKEENRRLRKIVEFSEGSVRGNLSQYQITKNHGKIELLKSIRENKGTR